MSEMVERIAKAIIKSESTSDGEFADVWIDSRDGEAPRKTRALAQAKIAINAMREPTKEMLEHAKPYMDSWSSNMTWWDSMIDAALK